MKWGKKKALNEAHHHPQTSSSRSSLMSHVFPASWLTKFKLMAGNREPKQGNTKRKVKRNAVPVNSPSEYANGDGGRFYGGDDDAYWRLSFGEENIDEKRCIGFLTSALYDSDNEFQAPPSKCRSCRLNCEKVEGKEETEKLNGMALGIKKTSESPSIVKVSPEIIHYRTEGDTLKTPRRRNGKDWRLRKMDPRGLEKGRQKQLRESDEAEEKSMGKNLLESETENWAGGRERKNSSAGSGMHQFVTSMKPLNSLQAGGTRGADFEHGSSEMETMEELKEPQLHELSPRSEKQRKSLHISRESQRRRTKTGGSNLRLYSPRTASKVEICKIKALEDMKKAKLKMKKRVKERMVEMKTGMESFAVVKCSFDPQQDFRDSMIEMIMEKRINRADELEELLACYLTLNSDEYHDLIIKVFRQVWFELNQAAPEQRTAEISFI